MDLGSSDSESSSSESSSSETDDTDSESDGSSDTDTDTDSDTEEEDSGFLNRKPVRAKQKGRAVYIHLHVVYSVQSVCVSMHHDPMLISFSICELWKSFGVDFIVNSGLKC